MDFDNSKVYGDTFISDGLVYYAKRQPFKLWPYQEDKEDKAKQKY